MTINNKIIANIYNIIYCIIFLFSIGVLLLYSTLWSSTHGSEQLVISSQDGNIARVKLLLRSGVDPSDSFFVSESNTPLQEAQDGANSYQDGSNSHSYPGSAIMLARYNEICCLLKKYGEIK